MKAHWKAHWKASRKSPNWRSNQAFTLLEVLVVIGILVILMGLVFMAMRGTTNAAKTLATRGTLNNLSAMFGELSAATNGSPSQPGVWLWTEDHKVIVRVPVDSGQPNWVHDFWQGPQNNTTIPATFEPLASPGSVAESVSPAQRNGSIAVVNTSLAMSQMAANMANRSRIQAIPLPQQFTIEWTTGPITMPGLDRFVGYWPTNNPSSDDPPRTMQYVAGVHVRWTDNSGSGDHQPHYYVGAASLTNGSPSPAQNVRGTEWMDETKAPYHVPLLRDAWDNPIIFVPASGMAVRMSNGKKNLDPTDPAQNFIVVSPEGVVQPYDPAILNSPFVTRRGRPFFASAGADGDFTTGDDNVYSFDK